MFTLMRLYWELIRRHWVVAALVATAFTIILGEAFWFGKLPQRLAYLGAVALSVVVLDLINYRQSDPGSPPPLPVRRPGLDLAIAVGCLVISFCFLLGHFSSATIHSTSPAVILFRLAGGLLALNVPIALIDLLVLRYRPWNLGYRCTRRSVMATPIILVFFFSFAYLSETSFTLRQAVSEQGSIGGTILAAVFLAAVPEEFFRMTWQTRFGAFSGNTAAAWFLTASLWVFMHLPNFHAGYTSWAPATIACFNMIPLGLLWGYVLHRTRSVVPSMILHCLNFSGLQNY
jgi:membrane protease YdiL (CAAX protease family)